MSEETTEFPITSMQCGTTDQKSGNTEIKHVLEENPRISSERKSKISPLQHNKIPDRNWEIEVEKRGTKFNLCLEIES